MANYGYLEGNYHTTDDVIQWDGAEKQMNSPERCQLECVSQDSDYYNCLADNVILVVHVERGVVSRNISAFKIGCGST